MLETFVSSVVIPRSNGAFKRKNLEGGSWGSPLKRVNIVLTDPNGSDRVLLQNKYQHPCGGSNENGFRRLINLNTWSPIMVELFGKYLDT